MQILVLPCMRNTIVLQFRNGSFMKGIKRIFCVKIVKNCRKKRTFVANMKIEKLLISNFKSILHLELSGFKRINLLIGRPNVGKSNIIEALSIFTIPQYKQSGFKKITDLIRDL